jgi:hypothetical protein
VGSHKGLEQIKHRVLSEFSYRLILTRANHQDKQNCREHENNDPAHDESREKHNIHQDSAYIRKFIQVQAPKSRKPLFIFFIKPVQVLCGVYDVKTR